MASSSSVCKGSRVREADSNLRCGARPSASVQPAWWWSCGRSVGGRLHLNDSIRNGWKTTAREEGKECKHSPRKKSKQKQQMIPGRKKRLPLLFGKVRPWWGKEKASLSCVFSPHSPSLPHFLPLLLWLHCSLSPLLPLFPFSSQPEKSHCIIDAG